MSTERIKIYTHSDADVDAGLFSLSPPPWLYDFKVIPENIIANKETLKDLEISEGDDVFFSGLFESHMGQKKNQPIFGFGKVALISEEKIEWGETKGDIVPIRLNGFRRGYYRNSFTVETSRRQYNIV